MHHICKSSSLCVVTLCHLSIAYSRVYENTEVNVRNLVIIWDCFHNLNTEKIVFDETVHYYYSH